MRKSPPNHRWPPILALLLLAGCNDLLDTVPPRPVASDDPAVAEADYPELAAVPQRPRLGYGLEQRRAIAEGLVADRANARYAGDALRRERERPVEADTAPPLPPAPAPPPVSEDDSEDLALAYVDEALARDSDDGSLGDFLDRLEEPPPGTAVAGADPETPAPGPSDIESAAGEADLAPPPAEAEVLPTTAEPTPASDAPVMARQAAADAALDLPHRIAFAADAASLPAGLPERARALVARIAAQESTIVVSGGGPRPGLAIERARRVAAMLVEAGLAADRIAIEMGGESDEVVVYEAGGEAG